MEEETDLRGIYLGNTCQWSYTNSKSRERNIGPLFLSLAGASDIRFLRALGNKILEQKLINTLLS